MDVMIGGKSAIDLSELHVKDWNDANEFLLHYGFDAEQVKDRRYIHAVFVESINFIAQYLMPIEWKRGYRPPSEILNVSDARDILLWASDQNPDHVVRQAWACGILRVMHTIAHLEGVRRMVDLESAQSQIMGRLNKHIFRDENGSLWLGTEDLKVKLHKVEWKLRKPRESIILKLLHKKANVAETIFDLFGVRIVTEKLTDVMVTVKLLRDLYLITFPNCNPVRARNTLLDVDHFRSNLEVLRTMLGEGRVGTDEFLALVERVIAPMNASQRQSKNPHTIDGYRSVQLTCRQMVTSKFGHDLWQERLEGQLAAGEYSKEVADVCQGLLRSYRNYRRVYPTVSYSFFPFEVHILDRDSYLVNKSGSASHARYKGSQLRAARRRVIGKVLTLKKLGMPK